jgi:hypothetical protein
VSRAVAAEECITLPSGDRLRVSGVLEPGAGGAHLLLRILQRNAGTLGGFTEAACCLRLPLHLAPTVASELLSVASCTSKAQLTPVEQAKS